MSDSSTPTTPPTWEKAVNGQAAAAHPRANIPDWKWKASLGFCAITTLLNGYDVSNVANIQARLYETFGNIQLLPWIGLSYSLASFAVLGLSRKILYCFDMRWVYIANVLVFMAGSAVAGAAPNIQAVIVGRIIMGVSGAIVYQSNLTFVAVFTTPIESPRLFSFLSAVWAVGLVIGGPIGSAFAANSDTTWRSAFYINLPFCGLALLLNAVAMPSKYLGPDISVLSRLRQSDPVGLVLNMASPILFAIALEFSGSVWEWSSGPTIAIWIVFGVVVIAWALQQAFSIFTTSEQRCLPLHLIRRLDLLPLWVASGCAGASYAITLYYTPLFFAFARGHDALQQSVRILPFILVFIVTVILVGGSLPKIGRFAPIYLTAGLFTVSAAAAMANTMNDPSSSESVVMVLEALIGIGLGCSFQHGVGISNVINKNSPKDRVDSAILFNMAQMGAIAIALAMAGSIFQNVGFDMLTDAIGDHGYTEHDLREALAGVSSAVWQSSDSEVLEKGIEAVSKVIARMFYLVVAAGALCLICVLGMKWGKLDYGLAKKKSEDQAEVESEAETTPERETA
ncbi:major facilitator superfamily domain-containing protein [Aspergillus undulatus]|uniref:major facilitator superfamily domain-containing protein n=1 Tax=Aspergillus undulatus TaxID=1810928 RepID=UPI003CCDC750